MVPTCVFWGLGPWTNGETQDWEIYWMGKLIKTIKISRNFLKY